MPIISAMAALELVIEFISKESSLGTNPLMRSIKVMWMGSYIDSHHERWLRIKFKILVWGVCNT